MAGFICRFTWTRGPETGERCRLGPRMEDGYCVFHSELDEERPYPDDLTSLLAERARRGLAFEGFQLADAPLRRVNLTGADLSGVDLSGGDLALSQLVKTKLGKADLNGAFLFGANIQEADLEQAYLRAGIGQVD